MVKVKNNFEWNHVDNEKKQQQLDGTEDGSQPVIKAVKRRYLILAMFIATSIIGRFHSQCLSSAINVVSRYYQVSNLSINMNYVLSMAFNTFATLPVSWIMMSTRASLRTSMLITTSLQLIGSLIKCLACSRDTYWLMLTGHLFLAFAGCFYLASSSRLAAIWFPENEVAFATATCTMGSVLGRALRVFYAPMMLSVEGNFDDVDAIHEGLLFMFLSMAVVSLLNTTFIVLVFQNEPKYPPSVARYMKIVDEKRKEMALQSSVESKLARLTSRVKGDLYETKLLLGDKNYLNVMFVFTIFNSFGIAVQNFLNQMLTNDQTTIFKQQLEVMRTSPAFDLTAAQFASNMSGVSIDQSASKLPGSKNDLLIVSMAGCIMIAAGMFAPPICGKLLDKFKQYRTVLISINSVRVISTAIFILSLLYFRFQNNWIIYLAAIPVGFTQTAFEGCIFDYAAEITYPRSELLSASLMTMSSGLSGMISTTFGSLIVDNYGTVAIGVCIVSILVVAFIVQCFDRAELKRQQAAVRAKPAG